MAKHEVKFKPGQRVQFDQQVRGSLHGSGFLIDDLMTVISSERVGGTHRYYVQTVSNRLVGSMPSTLAPQGWFDELDLVVAGAI